MEKRKLNNEGFSLIELIVVIAIMAILVGALAPQYLKFVERSRKSTDVQNVAAIKSALEVYAADPMVAADKALGDGTVKLTAESKAVAVANASGHGDLALREAGIDNIGLKSSKWLASGKTEYELNYTVSSNGTVSFTEENTASDLSILNGTYK